MCVKWFLFLFCFLMLDMDFFDRRILAVLRNREARDFQQILSEVDFSHNILRHHLDQLID